MTLSDEELERYARHIVLPQVGGVGQQTLRKASVAVIGAGGIGSAVIPALAGAGIGRMTIVDDDQVELANLHRQTIFSEGDQGRSKSALAATFAGRLNRFVAVEGRSERIDAGNASELLREHDLVVDGSDNFATRLAVSDACVALGIPLVAAAAIQFQGQVGLFTARPCYRCFVGDAFDTEDCDTCAENGVVGPLPGIIGQFAALIAINRLLGLGPVEPGQVHLLDGQRLQWRAIRIPPDSNCRACGSA